MRSHLLATWAPLALLTVHAAACSSDTPAPIGIPDGSIVFGADAPPIHVDAHIFDAPVFDARPPADAAPVFDASPFDAAMGDRFDVAYVSEWNLNAASGAMFTADQLALFINTGSTNLDMKTLQILSVTDDNADTDFRWFIADDDKDTRIMTPGTVHGADGNTHVSPLIEPLVPEPNDASDPTPLVQGGFTAHVGGSYDIHPIVMVQIGNAVAELDFLVHVTGNGGDAVQFVKASRVSSMIPPDAGVTPKR